jgi:stage II sporulation protein D
MRVGVAAALLALVLPGVARAAPVFVLEGGGWGHGVGMSQWGAEGFARHGFDYRGILAHYYPHTEPATAPTHLVRVLLKEKQHAVRISSAAPFLVVDAQDRKVHLRAGQKVAVTSRFVVAGRRLSGPLRFEPGVQPVSVGGDAYRGDVLVKARPGGLLVVNLVPLELYLRGVVPSEEPSGWHAAAYEAQAVAARSYVLASLRPGADFDVYPDQRSQVYGGIRAEEPWTNAAVAATAGEVLTYGGRPIVAYYFSTSGGRTSAVQDAFPWLAPEPYLVSVRDPYDGISPKHAWRGRDVSAAWLSRKLGLGTVRAAVERLDGSLHARSVSFRTSAGWSTFSGAELRRKLHLASTNFRLGTMELAPPASRRALLSSRVVVRGTVHGLRGVQLQRADGGTWRTIAYVHPHADGVFSLRLRSRTAVKLRLDAGGVRTDAAVYRVAR